MLADPTSLRSLESRSHRVAVATATGGSATTSDKDAFIIPLNERENEKEAAKDSLSPFGLHPHYSFCAPLRPDITSNPILVLLLFSPFGILAEFHHWSPLCGFICNFIPIIPIAWLLAEAAEQASIHTGSTIGALLTATFGNAPELILSILALKKEKVELVQASLLGSMLSTLVLMTGISLFIGGIFHRDQSFSVNTVVANSGLLLVSCMALSLPTMYVYLVPNTHNDLAMSYAAAGTLALVYIQFLYYQTRTHAHLFRDEEPEERANFPMRFIILAMFLLALVMGVHSEFLVRNVEGVVSTTGMNEHFIGVILLPIVGNSAEHVVAITAAIRNRMSLSVGIAFASCTQVAVFVVPVTVFAGWIQGVQMDLSFHVFEVIALILSVLIVAELMRGGTSSWLEGSLLLNAYSLLAFGFYWLPAVPPTGGVTAAATTAIASPSPAVVPAA